MYQDSIDRVAEFAPLIRILYEEILPQLSVEQRDIVLRLCGYKVVATAISIIETIKDEQKTYEDIAKETELSLNTVKQYCLGLSSGFPITCKGYGAIAQVGRAQKLIKIENKQQHL